MFVILGATGKVGTATVETLRNEGAAVRAVLRDPSKAARFAALGCEIAYADIKDTPALARAMQESTAVQVICPIAPQAENAAEDMLQSIASIGAAIDIARPRRVLAISDYGAHLSVDTGITKIFYALEQRLLQTASQMTFLRSAEHMENWRRFLQLATETGKLPSMHHPITKPIPMVSSRDIGTMAANLLLKANDSSRFPLVVHGEGPRRYTPLDVAEAMTSLCGRRITAEEIPRDRWFRVLNSGGLSESYAKLIVTLYEIHNKGFNDAERGVGEIRLGSTEIAVALPSNKMS
jgi:NAD(P)H dehydrogenase (quinone)